MIFYFELLKIRNAFFRISFPLSFRQSFFSSPFFAICHSPYLHMINIILFHYSYLIQSYFIFFHLFLNFQGASSRGGGGFSALATKEKKKSSSKDKEKDKDEKKDKDKDSKKSSSSKSSKSREEGGTSKAKKNEDEKDKPQGGDNSAALPGSQGEPLDKDILRRVSRINVISLPKVLALK